MATLVQRRHPCGARISDAEPPAARPAELLASFGKLSAQFSRQLAAQVLALLKPGPGKGHQAQPELATLRDQSYRLWTLLVQGHSELSAAAYWLWREDFRSHKPANPKPNCRLTARVLHCPLARSAPALSRPDAPPL